MDAVRERQSIRLPEYDYAQNGAYFITLCAYNRECVFGAIDDQGNVQLSAFGQIVHEEWLKTSIIRAEIELDEYVIMPNHFHAIVFIVKSDEKPSCGDTVGAHHHNSGADIVGAQRAAPLRPHVTPGSLGAIVRGFKSAVTKRVNERRDTPGVPVWQRNYYEHVIRNESSLNDIRSYIQTNPARWAEDQENPANVSR